MDPILAAAERVVGYLVPVALNKATELAEKIGKNAVDKIGAWLDRLRKHWAGDAEASDALEKFETNPQQNSEALRDVLADRMRREAALKNGAEQLAKDVGPLVVVTMKGNEVEIQEGPEFGKVLRGSVTVDMTLEKGKKQTGPKFGDLG